MKKTILKVLASMLVLAMAITAVVIPDAEAKAADKQMQFVVCLSKDETRVAKVLLDFDWNGAGLKADGTVDTSVGWNRDMYSFTKDASSNKWSINLTGDVDALNDSNKGATIQFLFIDSDGNMIEAVKFPLWDTRADNVNAYKNNSTLYFSVNVSGESSWSEIASLTEDPTAAKAADVIAAIDAIGKVSLSDDCKARITAARSAYDNLADSQKKNVTNYDVLTTAETKWSELLKDAAGTLTIHVKNEAKWDKVALYAYDSAVGTNHILGDWPGTVLVKDENNTDWLTVSTKITESVNLIFNNTSGTQTSDWKWVSANEYWVTIASDNSFTTSATAPTGWSTGKTETPSESESESQTPSESESEIKSDYVQKYDSLTVAGDFVDKLGNCSLSESWAAAGASGKMTHIGNGIYMIEITFDATTEELITVNYKVTINGSYDHNIAWDPDNNTFMDGGVNNLWIDIPAGTTSLKIYADENGWAAYDTLTHADEVETLLAKLPEKGDMDTAVIYMLILAGAAFVTVGAVSKKKFA